MARIKNSDVLAQLAALAAQLQGGNAPTVNATAVAVPKVPKAPKALTVSVETIAPAPGATFKNGSTAPFKVIQIDNGANGSYNRSKSLDRRYSTAFLLFLGIPSETVDALLTAKGL